MLCASRFRTSSSWSVSTTMSPRNVATKSDPRTGLWESPAHLEPIGPGTCMGDEPAGASLCVILVSDVNFLREGLREAFARRSEMTIATAETPSDALGSIPALRPDAILIDSGLPNGIEAVGRFLSAAPDVPVIALGVAENEDAVLPWAEAGIAGYVPRSACLADLTHTVRRVVRGEQMLPAKVAGAILKRLRELAMTVREERDRGMHARLTRREREVADLAADGLSNKLIARRLHIEVATAKCHVHNVLEKLKLQRRDELARWLRR